MADVNSLKEQISKTTKKLEVLQARLHLAQVQGPKKDPFANYRKGAKKGAKKAAKKSAKKATKRRHPR